MIDTLIDQWRRDMATDLSAEHVRKSVACTRCVARELHWTTPADIERSVFRKWICTKIDSGSFGKVTATKYHSSARCFVAYLVFIRAVEYNELACVKLPRVRRYDRGPGARPFGPDEASRLIQAAKAREAAADGRCARFGPNCSALYLNLVHHGGRYSETMRLRPADIDLGKLTVRFTGDKSGRGDTIPLHPEAVEALRLFLAWQDENKRWPMRGAGVGPKVRHVFWKVDHGTLVRDMVTAGVPRFDESGRGGLWHRWRKCAIRGWFAQVRSTQDLDKVRKLARHVSLDQTLAYVGTRLDELRSLCESTPTLNAAEGSLQMGGGS